jgi:hypothetical protein
MNKITKQKLLGLMIGTLLTGTAMAQYNIQSSWIMAEEGRAQQIFIGSKVLVGADLTFGNLGEMPYIQDDEADYTYEFNNGYINIGVDNADFTSDYRFNFEDAIEGPDGNVESFTLTRYRSAGRGIFETQSFDYSAGWELGSRYDMWKLNNHLTLGFTIAGGFSPLKADYSNVVNGDLWVQSINVPVSGLGGITWRDSGSYTSSELGSGAYVLVDDLNFDPSQEKLVTQILPDGSVVIVDSEVDTTLKVRGGLGTVRTGTYLDIYITQKLLFHLGFGISASYFSYDFTVDQDLLTSTLSTPYTTTDSTNGGEWLVGVYGEANLVYRINQKTSIYAGAQTHFIQDTDPIYLEETTLDIKLGQPTQFQAGFEFDF